MPDVPPASARPAAAAAASAAAASAAAASAGDASAGDASAGDAFPGEAFPGEASAGRAADAQDQYLLRPGTLAGGTRDQVRILSLSGGGYRGLFTARLLARIETDLLGGQPIGPCFDLIAGTSIGGIIATALVHGIPATAVCQVLARHGARIFPAFWFKAARKLVGKPLYDPQPLREAIHACLPAAITRQPLRDVDRALLVTTVDWVSAELHLLGSQPTPWRDALGLSVLDAMLATSAAPAHFAPHVACGHSFVDGGLAANAPDLLALQGARQMWAGAQVRLLSLGTAHPLGGGNPQAMPRTGLGWAAPAIALSMHAQERQVVHSCTQVLGSHYLRLNRAPSSQQVAAAAFDNATPASTAILMGLADQEFESIRGDKARLGQLLQMLR
jgi:uncharacterized protein